jgi:hypothetical protein
VRHVATLVSVALAASACGRFGYPESPDYCATIPSLSVPPVIDGALDPGLRLSPIIPIGWAGEGDDVPAGQRASYALAWRPDGLYVYVEVVDPDRVPAQLDHQAWCGDSIEIYADSDGRFDQAPAYDSPGALQFVVAAPGDDAGPLKRGEGYCIGCGDGPMPIDAVQFIAAPRADGYAVEMFVAGADLGLATWVLAASGQVGVDLSVNVSNPTASSRPCAVGVNDGNRLGQYFLHLAPVEPLYPFITPEAFCVATLTP